jgi:hypothetical protein
MCALIKGTVLLVVVACLSACHTRPARVDCDAHLQPINAPAPVAQKSEKSSEGR